MNRVFAFIPILMILGCSMKDKYDVARYHNLMEQDSVLTSIITYLYAPPVYTSVKDRFRPEHRNFYSSLTGKFSILKYYVAKNGTNYFYLLRPAAKMGDKRGVGGYFRMNDHFQLFGFREVFVTPILPEDELKNRCAFLFDEMVKGNIVSYLKMPTYVQWPNEVSTYDTTIYEWRLVTDSLN
jgi:hypothetical protein